MNLEEATTLLFCLHRDKSGGHERPHKPLLLLSIFDLIEQGLVENGQVKPSKELRNGFDEYFPVVRQGDDAKTPHNPFYFLSREPFWKIVMQPGFEHVYKEEQTKKAPTWGRLSSEVAYAQIDIGLFRLLQKPLERELLREAILDRFFPKQKEQLRQICSIRNQAKPDPQLWLVAESEVKPARDAAFRKLIREIYDYSCAACGVRVRLEGSALVEAAHIIPWENDHNDHPTNGMALCPSHHTAMDNNWIAPGLDEVWHVSPKLSEATGRGNYLARLEGKKLRRPSRKIYVPAKEGLEYRMDRLLR